jgi:hypothetical protein
MVHIQVVWIKHWYMTFIFNIEHSTGTGNNYRRKWPKSGIKLYTTSILWSFRAMIVTVPCIGIRYIIIPVKHIIIIIWEKFKDTTGLIRRTDNISQHNWQKKKEIRQKKIGKAIHRKLKIWATRASTKTGGEHHYPRMLSSVPLYTPVMLFWIKIQ